jgi:hypothetical protein
MTLQHHSDSAKPKFSKIHTSSLEVCQRKGPPICPSTAYLGAKILCIYNIYDMIVGCSQRGFGASTMTVQRESVSAITSPIFQNPPSPPEVYSPKGAPIYPSTAYQGAKTLCIHKIWMWDAVYGGLEGRPTDKTTGKPIKNAF